MKIGLVLSGGGGKGAYELGVWKALKELNLNKYISVFSGTSIGAFNAALFAMDDLEKAEKLWNEVTMDKLVPISKKELIKRGIGLYLGGKSPQAKRFQNGGALALERTGVKKEADGVKIRVYSPDGIFLGLGRVHREKNELSILKLF